MNMENAVDSQKIESSKNLTGFAIPAADLVWFIYRIVKGFLALNDNKPVRAGHATP